MEIIKKVRDKIIYEKDRLYLDFTASGLLYKDIEKIILEIAKTYGNTHSKNSHSALKTTFYYSQARESLKKSLDISDEFCVLPTGNGSTAAIKKFQEIIGIYIPPATKKRINFEMIKKPLVIVGPFEHHSNEISYREGVCDVKRVKLNEDGIVDLEKLKEILEENKDREIIASFSTASNVTGILNPIEKIYGMIKKYGGIMAVDAAAVSSHDNVDSRYYDALFLSPHKLIGGPGSSGLLVFRKSIYDISDSPTFSGGGVVEYVSRKNHIYIDNIETREDVGTPGIFQFIKASLAYELRNKVGLKYIKNKEYELGQYFLKEIKRVKNVELYAKNIKEKIGIFSFNIDDFSPYDISKILSERFKIETRAGCSCAGPYGHDLLGLKENIFEDKKDIKGFGWLRIGFSYIHEKKDIDYFIDSLKSVLEILENKK